MNSPKVISIGFAVPEKSYTQEDIFTALGYPLRFWRVFKESGIEKRHLWSAPDEARWLSWQQQQETYRDGAVKLSLQAINECLDGRSAGNIACVVYGSCTGFTPGPTVAHYLAKELSLKPSTYYTNIIGQGCFTDNHDVICYEGVKPIASVSTRDFVLGHDGKYHQVTRTFHRSYSGKIVVIKPHGFPKIEATQEHPFLVIRPKISGRGEIFKPDTSWGWGVRNWDWAPRWVRADELKKGDFLLTPRMPHGGVHNLKLSQFVKTKARGGRIYFYKNGQGKRIPLQKHLPNNMMTSSFIRLCGLYVAEGSADNEFIEFSFGEKETTLIHRCMSMCKRIGLSPELRPNKGSSGTAASLSVRAASSLLARFFQQWFGHKANQKHLPSWAFDLPAKFKEMLVEEMWAGDGCQTTIPPTYSTASKTLAQQLVILQVSLGKPSCLSVTEKNGYKGTTQYRVGQRSMRWKRLWGADSNYMWVPIKSLGLADFDGEVYNLEVKDVSSYVCNLISAHNCESGFPGLRRAYDFAVATGKQALVVNCELCSCTYYPEPDGRPVPENHFELLRSNAIFADAASCALVGFDDDPRHPFIVDMETHTNTKYINDLGYTWRDGRLRVLLSRRVPELAPLVVKPAVDAVLQRQGLCVDDIRWWVIHAAGNTVLDNIRDALGIAEEKVTLSRGTLREFGNTSSTSVGITGKRLMGEDVRPGDYAAVLSIGPGMTGGISLLQWLF